MNVYVKMYYDIFNIYATVYLAYRCSSLSKRYLQFDLSLFEFSLFAKVGLLMLIII